MNIMKFTGYVYSHSTTNTQCAHLVVQDEMHRQSYRNLLCTSMSMQYDRLVVVAGMQHPFYRYGSMCTGQVTIEIMNGVTSYQHSTEMLGYLHSLWKMSLPSHSSIPDINSSILVTKADIVSFSKNLSNFKTLIKAHTLNNIGQITVHHLVIFDSI